MTAEWTFASHDLTTAGDFITSVLSGYDLAEKRGNNVLIPYQDGKAHTTKYFDERTISFGITFLGTSLSDLQANIDTMLGYLGTRTRGLLVHTLPDSSTRQAYAEVVRPLQIQHAGPYLARGTVDFLCADPFFRSSTLYSTSDVTLNTTDAGGVAVDVVNGGSAEERRSIITFTGPLASPKLEHIANGVYIQYTTDLTSDEALVVDCGAFTATIGSTSVLNKITHHGDTCFIAFQPGTNHCHFTDSSASAPNGKCKVDFYTPYLSP